MSVFSRSITRSKRRTWSQCPLLPTGWIPQGYSCSNTATPTPTGTEAAFKNIPKSNISASLPLTQNTKLSFYWLIGWLKVYVVGTHVTIFIFPSIPINFLTHSTELTFMFTSKSIIDSFYLCKFFLRVLTPGQMVTSEAQLTQLTHHQQPDGNPSAPVCQGIILTSTQSASLMLCPGGTLDHRGHPRLVLFHTCFFLFHCTIDWDAWRVNSKMC